MNNRSSVAGRYRQLSTEREQYLSRARDAASLTIPSLFPSEDTTSNSNIPTPYQGMGARGVNNLAAKLLLTLLPTNDVFFRLTVDDFTLAELADETQRAAVEDALATIERAVKQDLEGGNARIALFEAIKHLIVTGNSLIYDKEDGTTRLYKLDSYVIKRDGSGNPTEIITVEKSSPTTLPQELQDHVQECRKDSNEDEKAKDVEIYTHVERTPKNWKVKQEVMGKEVEGSQGTYKLQELPWIPLRMVAIDGEDYGRSYVEEYIGDLNSLEVLTQAIVEGSAAAAKVVFLVRAGAVTKVSQLERTPNGGFCVGDPDDVSTLQLQKQADFRVASETIMDLKERLSQAFLLNASVTRNAERVTAEEIRYMAGELEDALGGIYSVLSQELQLPLVRARMARLTRKKKLPKLPQDSVKPSIVTGLEALGRGHDINRLQQLVGLLSPLGPEVINKYVNFGDFVQRVATGLGIDSDGLIRSEEEIQQQEQQAAMQQMGQQVAPEVVRGVMNQGE